MTDVTEPLTPAEREAIRGYFAQPVGGIASFNVLRLLDDLERCQEERDRARVVGKVDTEMVFKVTERVVGCDL